MTDALERFVGRAARAGLAITPRGFPDGTRTAADAAAAIGCDLAQIVKSLVFVADGRPVLVLTSGANRVDTDRVATHLDVSEVRKATADEVRAATGYDIGGTPPLGLDTEVDVLFDVDLTRHQEVWAAAGTARHVFGVSPATLLTATGARVVDVAAGP
jgi:prolyl-tRNA editing enzyme YbaK/EbsC (Cys-tRNA(Pro) deacylase)